jgi:hypothetical protein
MCWPYSTHGRGNKYVTGKPADGPDLRDLGVNGKIISKFIVKDMRCVWTGFIWLRIASSCELLTTRQ